jgi:hypothetical protein
VAFPGEEDDPGGDRYVERCYFPRHGDADKRVAVLLYLLMQTFSLGAHDDSGRRGPIHLVVIFGTALIDAVDPEAPFFKVFEGSIDIDNSRNGRIFQSAGGGFGDSFRQARGAAFGDYHRTGARGVGGANDCAQIVRIFDAIEYDDEPGVDGGFVEIGILGGGPESDDALMNDATSDALQRSAVFKADGGFGATGKIDDLLNARPAGAFRDEDAIEGSACFERLDYWMKTDQNSQGEWISW